MWVSKEKIDNLKRKIQSQEEELIELKKESKEEIIQEFFDVFYNMKIKLPIEILARLDDFRRRTW